MKLFIKDHRLLIGLQIVQFGLIFLILWLDGYRNIRTVLYAIFLGFILFSSYLLYYYITRRAFYKRLEQPIESLDESLQETDQAPIAEALDQLLKSQYRMYERRIGETEAQKEEHLTFIDRWVHQMKTPLSVIELTAQNLDEPESSNIREETDRIKTGLNTVLYMARLRTIEQDFRIKPVVLEKLVQEVNQENKRFFIRNEVYPKLEKERSGITVETDEKWLLFIMTQFIQNAVKYSAGKSGQMVISLYERAGSVIFEVTDFGVGIPEEDRKRIFNAFYTGKNGRKFRESTGMGLFLAKEVADYLGHRIEMESIVDKGTTIRIVFSPAQNITKM
ncbi:Signal transduction histidine kinase [Lentibacillus halodurans]|uniref:histidine kinase n=1 Tax=Lentibacillus halodurans TaxID=237679 RepID=A0A1I0VZ02_9BACI|nr:sensor histidine kinase [Lentibacillus halodurans]SFA81113.1 Signal transduction histidine kinase [Lentibacillus halodurans]